MTDRDLHLKICNLSKVYNKDLFVKPFHAVTNLSCDFPRGQCTGFMGHNGAGKTTTIKAIFGLIKPTKGKILYNDKEIGRQDKYQIGYMPEINKLPKNLSCEEILLSHLRIFKPKTEENLSPKSLVEQTLKKVDLWDYRKRHVSKLSKGMGRRLSWCQATIHNPDLIILDEPFSGLDPLGRQLMISLIREIKQSGKTIVLCTHELWSVNEVCDHLHILQKGKLSYSTLNPVDTQPPKPLFNYQLSIAGIDLPVLAQLKDKYQLPEYDYHDQKDKKHILGFAEYTDSCLWAKQAFGEGLIVTNFSKRPTFIEEDLYRFFIN